MYFLSIFNLVYFFLGHCITKTGLSHLCTHDQNGIEDLTPVFPYRIFFDPADIQFPDLALRIFELFSTKNGPELET